MSTFPSVEEDRAAGYRPTVGIILLSSDLVLLGREAGGISWHKGLDSNGAIIANLDAKEYEFGWKLPQGGIEPGESAEDAFFREIGEELRPGYEWLCDITSPTFFHHERLDFSVNKDGVRYRGKSYHYYYANVGSVGENYDNWVYGPNGDDTPCTSFATGQFQGGVFFSSYMTAQFLLTGLHLGRASTQALRVVHKLYAHKLITKEGDGFVLTKSGELAQPVAVPRFWSTPTEERDAWYARAHEPEPVSRAALFGFHF